MAVLGGIDAALLQTILIFSCVYAAGSLTLSLTAFPAWGWGAIVGLGAIAIGTGKQQQPSATCTTHASASALAMHRRH